MISSFVEPFYHQSDESPGRLLKEAATLATEGEQTRGDTSNKPLVVSTQHSMNPNLDLRLKEVRQFCFPRIVDPHTDRA